MVVVESKTQAEKYIVPITATIEMTLNGEVSVYAVTIEEAVAKVQVQIDTEALDGDIEMEDCSSGFRMSCRELKLFFSESIEIGDDNIYVDTLDEVTPDDTLRDDVKHLEAVISWDTDSLARRKAFLESLLAEDNDEQTVDSYSVAGLAALWRISEGAVWGVIEQFVGNLTLWQDVMRTASPVPNDFEIIPRQLAEMIRPKK